MPPSRPVVEGEGKRERRKEGKKTHCQQEDTTSLWAVSQSRKSRHNAQKKIWSDVADDKKFAD
jgi:hypothetical protein